MQEEHLGPAVTLLCPSGLLSTAPALLRFPLKQDASYQAWLAIPSLESKENRASHNMPASGFLPNDCGEKERKNLRPVPLSPRNNNYFVQRNM